jgi:hypothetical protein
VAWLITQHNMHCEQCNEIIDLHAGENAIVIEEPAEQCTIHRREARDPRLVAMGLCPPRGIAAGSAAR